MPDTVETLRHVRPRSPADDLSLSPPQAKKLRLDEGAQSSQSSTSSSSSSSSPPSSSSSEEVNLNDLPDDVLLHIFAFLHPIDLVYLTQTSSRLADVCQYKSLWEHVDSTSSKLSAESITQILQHVKRNTKTIKFRGNNDDSNQPSDVTFSKKMMKLMCSKAPFLKTFVMENHLLDGSDVVLEDFPETLEHLAIRDTEIRNSHVGVSYTFRIHNLMPTLKVLDLTNSVWFNPHCLLAISKITTLEVLILDGCDVTDFMPYASLASKFGFKKLESLDLRNTEVGDSDVTCFSEKESLRRLYLSASPSRVPCMHDSNRVSDSSITTFGARRLAIINNRFDYFLRNIEFGAGAIQPSPCQLDTLVLRNYPEVTDLSLRHVANHIKTLKFLDVTGCGCTTEGLVKFRTSRPDVTLLPQEAT